MFECQLCEYEATRDYNLKSHVMSVHEHIRPFMCEQCEQRFSTKQSLQEHVRLQHRKAGEDKGHISCNYCPKQFGKRSNMTRHIRSCHPLTVDYTDKTYLCKKCEKRFSRTDYLKLHLQNHEKGSKYHCPYDLYETKDRSNYLRHFNKCTKR